MPRLPWYWQESGTNIAAQFYDLEIETVRIPLVFFPDFLGNHNNTQLGIHILDQVSGIMWTVAEQKSSMSSNFISQTNWASAVSFIVSDFLICS